MFRKAVLLVVGCASLGCSQDTTVQGDVARTGVPEKLVPVGRQALFMVRAEGVQIYAAEEAGGKLQWVFKSPRAELFDYKTGERFGTHSAGPIWEDNDGGKLTGKKVASEDAPNAGAIPWLLLEATERGGRFSKVTNIQRLNTWGGLAPAVAPTKEGESREVRYEATYVFLGDR